jgi:hypothetical protein
MATILNKSCSPIVSLQVCHNDYQLKSYEFKTTEVQILLIVTIFRKPKTE